MKNKIIFGDTYKDLNIVRNSRISIAQETSSLPTIGGYGLVLTYGYNTYGLQFAISMQFNKIAYRMTTNGNFTNSSWITLKS